MKLAYKKLIINPETKKYQENNRYTQKFIADAGYDTEKIINKLTNDGYTFYVGKNIRRAKEESFDIIPISDKNYEIYNKRVGIENMNALIKQYTVLNHIYEKTTESYMGFLQLALSYIVYGKYLKIIETKKKDKITREKEQIERVKENKRKYYARKLKRQSDEKKRNDEKKKRQREEKKRKDDEKETRLINKKKQEEKKEDEKKEKQLNEKKIGEIIKKRKVNNKKDNKNKQTLYLVNLGDKVRYITIFPAVVADVATSAVVTLAAAPVAALALAASVATTVIATVSIIK